MWQENRAHLCFRMWFRKAHKPQLSAGKRSASGKGRGLHPQGMSCAGRNTRHSDGAEGSLKEGRREERTAHKTCEHRLSQYPRNPKNRRNSLHKILHDTQKRVFWCCSQRKLMYHANKHDCMVHLSVFFPCHSRHSRRRFRFQAHPVSGEAQALTA